MTKLYGVIGDPIKHSLSALMQNRALQEAKMDAVYLPFHVPPQELKAFVEAARRWPCHGFNITLPHKRTIQPYLDELSEEAHIMGAVNTVTNREGYLFGTNTDATGYIRSLQEECPFQVAKSTATVLGAGGAAHAVIFGLLNTGVEKIFLFNRTPEKSQQLKMHFAGHFPQRIEAHDWDQERLGQALAQSQLLVNATSVGLNGTEFSNLPLDKLPAAALVSDLVYRPRQTPLLRDAAERGLNIHEGLGMLVHQGAESFRIWTGQEPDRAVMRQALEEALALEEKID